MDCDIKWRKIALLTIIRIVQLYKGEGSYTKQASYWVECKNERL